MKYSLEKLCLVSIKQMALLPCHVLQKWQQTGFMHIMTLQMLLYDQARPRVTERMETWSYPVTIQRVLVLQALRYIFHSETHREHSVFRISRISRGKRPHARRPLVRRTPASRFNMHLVDTFLRVTSTKVTVHIKPGLTVTYRRQASPPIITDTTTELF